MPKSEISSVVQTPPSSDLSTNEYSDDVFDKIKTPFRKNFQRSKNQSSKSKTEENHTLLNLNKKLEKELVKNV